MNSRVALLGIGIALAVSGCLEPPSAPGGQLVIAVAPLQLPGLTDARYTVTVTNAAAAVVWSRSLTSTRYGDGAGSLSYVGPCDADESPNTVALVLDELSTAAGPLSAVTDYANPAPALDPVRLTRPCTLDEDTPVDFDLTIARAATQGFFDVSVEFSDIFCSAKLDCQQEVDGVIGPLKLLTNGDGARDLTVVLGFACTAGEMQDTQLYLSDVVVSCDQDTYTVDPGAGPGQLNPAFGDPTQDLLFQAAVYRGAELLGDYHKGYWNVALGLNDGAFAYQGDCTLEATATATDGPLAADTLAADRHYPLVTWNVPISSASAVICTRHALNDATSGAGVDIVYNSAALTFANAFEVNASPTLPPAPTSAPWYSTAPSADFEGVFSTGALGADTVWASESGGGQMRKGVVLAYDFEGDFEVIATWGHNYLGFGAVWGPTVHYADVNGYSGDVGPYWGNLTTTGFPVDYAATHGAVFGGHYSNHYVGMRWSRSGTQLSIQSSPTTSPTGPWSHLSGSPFTVPLTDKVVIGTGESDYSETSPLTLHSMTVGSPVAP